MALTPVTYRFSVEEYHLMAEAGIFHEDDRVELLDGEVVQMTPIGCRHASRVDRLNRRFVAALGERAIVRVQNPVGGGHAVRAPARRLPAGAQGRLLRRRPPLSWRCPAPGGGG